MNLRQSFNLACALQLDRVKSFGYRRAVEFHTSLAGAPFVPASPRAGSLEEEKVGRSPLTGKSDEARAARMQLLRTNRNILRAPRYYRAPDSDLTDEQRRRRRNNAVTRANKMAKAQLTLAWPTQES